MVLCISASWKYDSSIPWNWCTSILQTTPPPQLIVMPIFLIGCSIEPTEFTSSAALLPIAQGEDTGKSHYRLSSNCQIPIINRISTRSSTGLQADQLNWVYGHQPAYKQIHEVYIAGASNFSSRKLYSLKYFNRFLPIYYIIILKSTSFTCFMEQFLGPPDSTTTVEYWSRKFR